MNPRAARLFDEVLEFFWKEWPTTATSVGVHDHDHRLLECDPEAIAARARALSAYRRDLEPFLQPAASLTPDEALDARVLSSHLEMEERLLREMRTPFRDPGLYFDEILYGVYYLVQRNFAPLPERAHRAARRLREVPRLLRQAAANLADPAQVPPPWIEAALRLVRGALEFFGHLETDLVPGLGSAGEDLRTALVEARGAIDGFAEILRSRILPEARGDLAIGRPLFEALLRAHHGLPPDADAMHQFGLDQVARTQERLEEAARRIDPKRSWRDLVAEWKADHPTREGFLAEYRQEVDKAREFVRGRGLVTFPSGERLHVMETPSFQRSVCPFAAYLAPGPFESEQDGYFWITPPDEQASSEDQEKHLQDHLRPGIPGATAHEAYPGHHLQLTVANRIESKVRRGLATPVLIEGWAFYCEQMMAEEGYYDDPRSQVLQLKDELWRSCRVVIDVGLQTRGMTIDQAVAILNEVACLEVPSARGEVLRYTRFPTQPMSYAAGKHAILGLRDDYRRRHGSAYSLRQFHDTFLSFGSIPVALIRERMLAGSPGAGA